MTAQRTIRCAIYTRKSSEEGLEQDFNSLDAQHAACAAYILSQKHEGWRQVAQRYDDGGLSGSNLERPALRRLMADIGAGRIDMVVIYKIDRLTRALTDFARLVERFDAANCSFVSVTQAFNTSTSMGRLTLNVLLSFAQFEREVTAERIRDKIGASKQKGMWMGGLVPMGYEADGRTLRINETEATDVRTLFSLYLEHGCIRGVKAEADKQGIVSKRRSFSTGGTCGGVSLSQGALHYLLTNPVYVGEIRHKGKNYPGQHPPLIERAVWDAVQAGLQDKAARPRQGNQSDEVSTQPHPSPLAGKLVDETGDRLTPSHAGKNTRRHRYYVSRRLVTGTREQQDLAAWRLPGEQLERVVADGIVRHLRRLRDENRFLVDPSPSAWRHIEHAFEKVVTAVESRQSPFWPEIVSRGQIAPGLLSLDLDGGALGKELDIDPVTIAAHAVSVQVPFQLRRRGVEARMVTGLEAPAVDPLLCRTIARALDWMDEVRGGRPIAGIAAAEGVTERFIRARLPMALLSPAIVTAIEQGRQPPTLTTETLVRMTIPTDWTIQAKVLGIAG